MHSWKLLGDLLPRELRLECERAGLKAVEKDSHNFVKLAKYILSNGYDPESFYFNTLYQADKSNPLLGMMNNGGAKNLAGVGASGLTAVPGVSSVLGSTMPPTSDEASKALFALFSKMSQDIQRLVSVMEVKEKVIGSGLGVGRSHHRSPSPDLPLEDSFESMSSSTSSFSVSSSGNSRSSDFWGRQYDKSLLIKDKICLAYQHGNCIYDDQAIRHENAYGQKVLHYCGLCWSDSPDNQCYYAAIDCPGPEHNL